MSTSASIEAPSAYHGRVDGADWEAIAGEVDELGCALTPQLLAIRAGYRPCAVCMPDAYLVWNLINSASSEAREWWISTGRILQTNDPSAASAS